MKRWILIVLVTGSAEQMFAQNVGLSFSYFIPRHGYFSTPISPFSFRGVGVNLNRFVALETGVSLYRMSGLNMIDLPFTSREPFVGPNFTLFVPAELVFQLKGRRTELDFKAGGFAFHGFDQKLLEGNIDRALRSYQQWEVANSYFRFDNQPGVGWHTGAELLVYVTRQVGVSLEVNYLRGQSKFPLSGSFTGGTAASGLQTLAADYPDAKIDFTGWEFSLGIIFTGGSRRR